MEFIFVKHMGIILSLIIYFLGKRQNIKENLKIICFCFLKKCSTDGEKMPTFEFQFEVLSK